MRRFVIYHGKRHPSLLGEAEVNVFLTALATDRGASPSTQNQAAAAIAFLYREVLHAPLGQTRIVHARRPRRQPDVLTREEVRAVLGRLRLPFDWSAHYYTALACACSKRSSSASRTSTSTGAS